MPKKSTEGDIKIIDGYYSRILTSVIEMQEDLEKLKCGNKSAGIRLRKRLSRIRKISLKYRHEVKEFMNRIITNYGVDIDDKKTDIEEFCKLPKSNSQLW